MTINEKVTATYSGEEIVDLILNDLLGRGFSPSSEGCRGFWKIAGFPTLVLPIFSLEVKKAVTDF